jgi:hemolysin III
VADRPQSLGEEIANSVSHGVGLVAAVAGLAWLLAAGRPQDAAAIVGASVFGGTMVLLYAASTLYHARPSASP